MKLPISDGKVGMSFSFEPEVKELIQNLANRGQEIPEPLVNIAPKKQDLGCLEDVAVLVQEPIVVFTGPARTNDDPQVIGWIHEQRVGSLDKVDGLGLQDLRINHRLVNQVIKDLISKVAPSNASIHAARLNSSFTIIANTG